MAGHTAAVKLSLSHEGIREQGTMNKHRIGFDRADPQRVAALRTSLTRHQHHERHYVAPRPRTAVRRQRRRVVINVRAEATRAVEWSDTKADERKAAGVIRMAEID